MPCMTILIGILQIRCRIVRLVERAGSLLHCPLRSEPAQIQGALDGILRIETQIVAGGPEP